MNPDETQIKSEKDNSPSPITERPIGAVFEAHDVFLNKFRLGTHHVHTEGLFEKICVSSVFICGSKKLRAFGKWRCHRLAASSEEHAPGRCWNSQPGRPRYTRGRNPALRDGTASNHACCAAARGTARRSAPCPTPAETVK